MAKKTGLLGSVVIGSTTFHVTKWNYTANSDWADTTDTSNAGYKTQIPGLLSAEGSFTAMWDSSIVYTSAPNIAIGTNIALKLNYADTGTYANFPSASITSKPTTSQVSATAIEFTVNFKSNGAFTEGN
jgi:hypothetical protein